MAQDTLDRLASLTTSGLATSKVAVVAGLGRTHRLPISSTASMTRQWPRTLHRINPRMTRAGSGTTGSTFTLVRTTSASPARTIEESPMAKFKVTIEQYVQEVAELDISAPDMESAISFVKYAIADPNNVISTEFDDGDSTFETIDPDWEDGTESKGQRIIKITAADGKVLWRDTP
jgi:hypothetical protein